MSHYPRLRIVLSALGTAAFLGIVVVALWVQAAPVGSAPAGSAPAGSAPAGSVPPYTVVPPSQTMATGSATGTVLPPVVPPLRSGAPTPNAKANYPGLPAIMPSLMTMTASAPAITEQDVRAYLGATPHFGPRIEGTGVTVKRVIFATNIETRKQIGRAIDTADDRLICTVELAGNFTVSGPQGTMSSTRPTAYLFFDAKTGNLLEENVP